MDSIFHSLLQLNLVYCYCTFSVAEALIFMVVRLGAELLPKPVGLPPSFKQRAPADWDIGTLVLHDVLYTAFRNIALGMSYELEVPKTSCCRIHFAP